MIEAVRLESIWRVRGVWRLRLLRSLMEHCVLGVNKRLTSFAFSVFMDSSFASISVRSKANLSIVPTSPEISTFILLFSDSNPFTSFVRIKHCFSKSRVRFSAPSKSSCAIFTLVSVWVILVASFANFRGWGVLGVGCTASDSMDVFSVSVGCLVAIELIL
jgi:hypothetical protein